MEIVDILNKRNAEITRLRKVVQKYQLKTSTLEKVKSNQASEIMKLRERIYALGKSYKAISCKEEYDTEKVVEIVWSK